MKRRMTRKQKRVRLLISAAVVLSAAAVMVFSAVRENLVYFHAPSDVLEKALAPGKSFRMGGLVEEGSRGKLPDGLTHIFRITDLAESIDVRYAGLLPDLFREGQGVVAEGALDDNGVFVATEVLAKHDENYMPPEVAESLKKQGHWQEKMQQGMPGETTSKN